MNKNFICSSIKNFLNESIITKIRQWHIELCNNKKLEYDKNSLDFIDFILFAYSMLPHWKQKVNEVFSLIKALTKQL